MAKMTGSEIFFLLWQLSEVLFGKQKETPPKTTAPEKVSIFIPTEPQTIIDLRPEPEVIDPIVLVENPSPPPIPSLITPIPIVTTPPVSATVLTLRTII